MRRGQAGIEYLIGVGFVTFSVLTVFLLSNYYSGLTKDKIKVNQMDSFFNQLINNAETVYFSGEPSQTTINLFLPSGVSSISISNQSILVHIESSTGENIKLYSSRVPLQGNLTNIDGTKTMTILAREEYVLISQQ